MYLASTLTPLAIPSTLQDSLMARLDRLAHGQGDRADRGGDRARDSRIACWKRSRRSTGRRWRTRSASSWRPN